MGFGVPCGVKHSNRDWRLNCIQATQHMNLRIRVVLPVLEGTELHQLRAMRKNMSQKHVPYNLINLIVMDSDSCD